MEYYSFNQYLKDTFGEKVYKISLNGGFTCPNRDGKIDTRGCIFCSKGGSGDFAESPNLSITQQIENGKAKIKNKTNAKKFIAYFQAFTNTYASIERLKSLYFEALNNNDIVALSIGTRPDCLDNDVLELLNEVNKIKPVFVELGLQTSNEKSAKYIRRGYTLDVYDKAVENLKNININVVTHIILGLPNETKEHMLNSVSYVVSSGASGIKLQLLHILKNTDLELEYEKGKFNVLTMDEYLDILYDCLKIIPKTMVVHRVTGDGAKKDLIAPLWSGDKKKVLNAINNYKKQG